MAVFLILNLEVWERFFSRIIGGKKFRGRGIGGIFKTKELKCTETVQSKNRFGAGLQYPAVRILALIYRGLRHSGTLLAIYKVMRVRILALIYRGLRLITSRTISLESAILVRILALIYRGLRLHVLFSASYSVVSCQNPCPDL